MADPKQNRIKAQINKYARFCDLDPEDFTNKDVNLIAEYANVSRAEVWDYINHWYRT